MAESKHAAFNGGAAVGIAKSLGFEAPWKPKGVKVSSLFAYFADGERLLIVAGEATRSDAGLALAYGLTWRGGRKLVLALPANRAFATTQRAAWLNDAARPVIFLHDGAQVLDQATIDPVTAVNALRALIPHGDTPEVELRKSFTPLHLGEGTGSVGRLTEWASSNRALDPAHRQSYRAWHHMGQSVLEITRRGGVRVRAGLNEKGATATTVEVKPGQKLSDVDRAACIAAVKQAMKVRATGSYCKPDEHWLQAVLRAEPRLAGVEQPALREVPAWRPPSDPDDGLNRGYLDVLGLDGDGDIRVVETKLAANDDTMLIFQGLDYYTWARAYDVALRHRLGAADGAQITLCYLIGATPDALVKVSRYAQAQVNALSPSVPAKFVAITDWFAPKADKGPTLSVLDSATLPT